MLQIRSRPFQLKCATSTMQLERERVARTRNSAEGWHNLFQALLSWSAPKIRLFLQKKIQQWRSLFMRWKLPHYCAPGACVTKKFKNRCKTSETVMRSQKFCLNLERLQISDEKKISCALLLYVLFILICCNSSFFSLSPEKKSVFLVFGRNRKMKLKEILILYRDALQPPGVRLRILTWLTGQFNPRDTLVRSEVHLDNGLANSFEKCRKPVTGNQTTFRKLHLISFWCKAETSFLSLVHLVICPIWPLKVT